MSEAIEPLQLIVKGSSGEITGKTVAWACGKCRIVCLDEIGAREHCVPLLCSECGAEREFQWRTSCEACHAKYASALQRTKLDEATEIEGVYDDYVYSDLYSEYYSDTCIYLDDMANMDAEPEEFLYACTSFGVALNSEWILEQALEEHHEDAHENIIDGTGLQKLLNEWCAKQTVETWMVDYKRKVRVPKRDD